MSMPSAPTGRDMGRLLALAVGLGVLGAGGAVAFLAVENTLQGFFWDTLPGLLGFAEVPWWWIPPMLLVGAGLIVLAWRLGPGMASPLEGFHFDVGPDRAAAALSVAMASLVFGAVIGPEAPLIVCGTVIGGLVTRRQDPQIRQLAMAIGGIAAIGAILGNPFITAFMILEFAATGALPRAALMPLFVGLGAGYLVEIGFGPYAGIAAANLDIPGLPAYDHVQFGDFAGGAVVAIVAAIAVLIARTVGHRVAVMSRRSPIATILGSAVVISGLAIVVMLGFDQPYDTILFSGESAMSTVIAETSVLAVLVIAIAKALAYGVTLGSGWRGGPIFPSAAIGCAVGVVAALLIPSLPLTGMVVAGVAGCVAAMLRLPFTAALIAVLIASGGSLEATPLAIVGAILGAVLRMAYDRRFADGPVEDTTSPQPQTA